MHRNSWIGFALLAAATAMAACGGGSATSEGTGGAPGTGGTGGDGATGGSPTTGTMTSTSSGMNACGDGVKGGTEDCDGMDFGGFNCTNVGFGSGTLLCNSDCTFNSAQCDPCGNDKLDANEQCDGANLGGADCVSEGFAKGTLGCKANCTYDTSQCDGCGNNVADANEGCDGPDLKGFTCVDLGYGSGALQCGADCNYDATFCSDCGNNLVDPGEDCDGMNLGNQTCITLGFEGGVLTCGADCKHDKSGCASENCTDGIDNDLDGQIDCSDSSCTMKCADACLAPPIIADPSITQGNTQGHADVLQDACEPQGGSGPEVIYQFTATKTGVLDLKLTSTGAGGAPDLSLSVRTQCANNNSEVSCADVAFPGNPMQMNVETLTVPILQGQTVFIMVEGYGDADSGPFTLEAKSRSIVCGDGIKDPGEACDDGNVVNGDGCNNMCVVEVICGDNFKAPSEQCDDGNLINGDGCSSTCMLESACGNGVITPPETCDDGNTLNGDGCSSTCQCELNFTFVESEANNTFQTADPVCKGTINGGITIAGDQDWFKVYVPGPASSITATTIAGGGNVCASNGVPPEIDSEIAILGTNGTTVLATNDDIDGVNNWCSTATATNLAAGTYYVRVMASVQFCATCTFNYGLTIN